MGFQMKKVQLIILYMNVNSFILLLRVDNEIGFKIFCPVRAALDHPINIIKSAGHYWLTNRSKWTTPWLIIIRLTVLLPTNYFETNSSVKLSEATLGLGFEIVHLIASGEKGSLWQLAFLGQKILPAQVEE